MKVAFISQPFERITPPVQASSIAIWTDRVIQILKKQDAEFLVYARKFANQPAFEQYDRVYYRRVPGDLDEKLARPFKLVERLSRYPFPKRPFFATSLNHWGYIRQIARDLQTQSVDIVHVHNFSQFVPIIRALNPQARIVLHMQCEWLSQLDRKMIERRLHDADLIVTCSEFTTGRVRSRFPQFASRCHTVFNGVDLERFVKQLDGVQPEIDRPKQLLFVGRVSPEKGVHDLLTAMKRVVSTYPNVQVNVVGPPGSAPFEYMVLISDDPKVRALSSYYTGPLYRDHYFEALKGQAASLDGKVNFTGSVPHHQTVQYYQTADILINPSLTEAFGMSLVEAMASHVPVIATRVGGMTEVVDEGKTGLLVESSNPDALADAILQLLENDPLRCEMGKAGFNRVVGRYSWDCIAENLWHLYKGLMENKRAG